MPGYDKVFAAEWLDDRQVLVGTKCGQLVVIDSATGRRVDVPLANDIYGESSMALCNAGRSPSIEFENRLSASRPSVSSDRHQAQEPLSDPDPPSVRSICMSPCGNLLAVSRGSEIQILSLPELSPVGLLHAHTDVIFSLDWISDTILVSGGRDGSVRFWDTAAISSSPSVSLSSLSLSPSLFPTSSLPTLAPLPNTINHSHRVRALTYSPQTSTLLTLTTTSKVKLYSLSAARPLPLFSHTLPRTRDPTCSVFSSTQNTFIVGSADRLHFIDPRAPDLTHVVRAFDDDNGVRSLATTGSVVAVGSGGGFVSFYDLRAGKYIEWEENGYVSTLRTTPKSAYNAPAFSPLHPAVTMSTESLAADVPTHVEEGYTTYLPAPPATPHFDPTHDTVFESPTAIYALGFSRCGGRLVAAGGPLHVNVGGCMGGVRIWA
ncbi:DDB1- and CUL4-associated factor 12 [Gaertneriomyces sp. JEL0708]|nr:DDB1- and CUL4-associated factor 12 [Gaertneriomyces sp. JEL0708]